MNFWPFVDIPYRLGGRDRDGCDCYGLVALVYRELWGIDLPLDTAVSDEPAAIAPAIARQRPSWRRLRAPGPGDLVLLSVKGVPCHCGLWIGDGGHVLHAHAPGKRSGLLRLGSILWPWARVEGYYRFAGRP